MKVSKHTVYTIEMTEEEALGFIDNWGGPAAMKLWDELKALINPDDEVPF
jgi:hypothetical protein